MLAQNNIIPDLLGNTFARVPAENYANLLRDTMQEMQDELLGYGSQVQRLGSWSTMVELTCNSQDLGEALRKLARFYRLIPWGLETRLTVDERTNTASIALISSDKNSDFDPYLYESFLFYIYRTANWLLGRQIQLLSIDFCFEELPHSREYRHLYLCNDIKYQKEVSQFYFNAGVLSNKVDKSPVAIEAFLQHVNLAMITQVYRQKSWHHRVSLLLESQLSENPSFVDIAAACHLHPHTLRHYLRVEGFQYKEIKDRVRCDTAIHALSRLGKSVEQTAELTGFSEASAFIKAFKKWTGTKPAQYKNIKHYD